MIIIEVGMSDVSKVDEKFTVEWLRSNGVLGHFAGLPIDGCRVLFTYSKAFTASSHPRLTAPLDVAFVRFSVSANTHGDVKRIGKEMQMILRGKFKDLFEDGCRHLGCGV